MKSIQNYIIIAIFIVSNAILLSSQDTTNITANGMYNMNTQILKVKWVPDNADVWLKGLDVGYTIKSQRIKDSIGNQVFDTIINRGQVFPYTSNQFAQLNSVLDSNLLAAASLLVNLDTINNFLALPDTVKLVDVVNNNNVKNEFYTYSLLLADQDFLLARGLALAFSFEEEFLPNEEYLITVVLNDTIVSRGDFILKINNNNSLSAPSKPTALGKNLKAEITWSSANIENQYVYYDIFRSDDNGSTFNKVNAFPYIKMEDENLEHDTLITYSDSLPQNNFTYIYKVRGISPYGLEAPFSDTVHVKGIPLPLNIAIRIDSFKFEDTAYIQWAVDKLFENEPAQDSLIAGFNIYVKESFDGTGVKINSTLLSDTLRSYQFIPNVSAGYFIVEALDSLGRSYLSISKLGQGIDSVPPAPPINLSGIVKESGSVILTWDKNTEDDLIGYKVFFSNSEEGEYAQITVDVVTDTTFVTFTDLSFGLDKLFYHVRAVDGRYNLSEPSNIAVLNRPDKIAPSNPLLSHVLPRPEGVRVAWKLSSSTDVFSHYLQRKLKSGNQWQNIIDVRHVTHYPPMTQESFEMVPSNYVDTSELLMTYYQYRLIAVDSFGNTASSEIITLKPYDDGIRGEVRNLQGTFYDLTTPNSGLIHPDLNVIANMPNGNTNFIGKDACVLKWEYGSDFPSTHRDFKIYFRFVEPQGSPGGEGGGQAPPGGGAGLDQHGDIEDFKLIKTITAYNSKKVADALQHTGFAFAHVIDRKDNDAWDLEYKIVATHTDGGFSLPVTVVVEGY